MDAITQKLKWIIQKSWTEITIYHLVVTSLTIWLFGVWLWIIPVYKNKIQFLKSENKKLADIVQIHRPATVKSIKNINQQREGFNYAVLLGLTEQHGITLDDFRKITGSTKHEYQFVVKGSWLKVREFLETFKHVFSEQVLIESFDFQRDVVTNELGLTMSVLEVGKNENP
ncbi:hypothetical protein [Acinetobacter gyllenbergii]|uniref:hypothetical protein n=1 Tax=Acinetobacter gyllenbergii TaxID=134534 RepID=UPI000806CA22|nr:hypothetical protein [Acinetobacter gyllenbergii]OBY74846.1 hypothetical protein NG55_07855 [Acinetobacter gyllenbergii]